MKLVCDVEKKITYFIILLDRLSEGLLDGNWLRSLKSTTNDICA